MGLLTEKRRQALLSHVNLVEYTMRQLPTSITGARATGSREQRLALGPARSLYDQLKTMCEINKELLREHVAIDADAAPAEKVRPQKITARADVLPSPGSMLVPTRPHRVMLLQAPPRRPRPKK